MKLQELDYDLPVELIAQRPVEVRDRSRLMVLDRLSGRIEHRTFTDLPYYFDRGDALVINDTKVMAARLHGHKASGGGVEILLVRDLGDGLWEALVKANRRLRMGDTITVAPGELEAELVEVLDGGKRVIRFQSRDDLASALSRWGKPPLPPYIKRDDGSLSQYDKDRYQTIYAAHEGAIAAPTAGLHFTPELLDTVRSEGVRVIPITLHVGLGTFQPIRTDVVEDHILHAERYQVSPESAKAIQQATDEGGRVVAVGTTVTRTLETVSDESGWVEGGSGQTETYIYPGYTFKIVKSLLTNFHLPKSTLLALVIAFGGYDLVMRAYREAVSQGYRFYSYGDAMLIL